jgi:hypothetical protein
VSPAVGTGPGVADPFEGIVAGYQHAGKNGAAFKERRLATVHYQRLFADVTGWRAAPITDRLAAAEPVRAFASWAAVMTTTAVDAGYVVASRSKWGKHVAAREPATKAEFYVQAASLGFDHLEIDKMWSKLSQISVIAGTPVAALGAGSYAAARDSFRAAVIAARGHAPKTLNTPLFGLDAVMFHRGQGPTPVPRKPWAARSTHEIQWEQVHAVAPVLAGTVARYLDQLAVSLRPSSVAAIDITLRQLAGWVIAHRPDVTCVAGIDRACIEGYKAAIAARPGYRGITTLSKTTIGMRVGHLRAFFERIIEWGYPDAPPGLRCSPPTGRSRTGPCRRTSTTRPPPRSWPPPGTCPSRWTGCSSRSSPAPACARANSSDCASTPSSRSDPRSGCAPRSASSTPTATSPCTPP